MSARGLMEAGSLPVRFMMVVAVWAVATLTLGSSPGAPLPVFVVTSMAVLVLTYVFARQYEAEYAPASRSSATHTLHAGDNDDADDVALAASFADHFIAKEFAAAQRGRDVTLVMFGFSRFEQFTAEHGNTAAANALREFGRILQRLTRQMNLTARYGWRADSFLSVLSDANAASAAIFIERVRAAAGESRVHMPEIEAGIAVYQPHLGSPDELVEGAQRALEAARAKHGRMMRL
jgi:diguanylate cyclase (GGDEF)-like protein